MDGDMKVLVSVHGIFLLCQQLSSKSLPYAACMLWVRVLSLLYECGRGGSERLNTFPRSHSYILCSQPLPSIAFSYRKNEQNLPPRFLAKRT